MVKTYSYYGKEFKISELCQLAKEKYHQDISASAMTKRLRHMSVKQAMQLPVRPQRTTSAQYDLVQLQAEAWNKYHLKLTKAAISQRLQRGWSTKKAISIPRQATGTSQLYQFKQKLWTINELADYAQEHGYMLPKNIIRARLGLNWDVQRAISTPLTRNTRYWYHGHQYTLNELIKLAAHHGNFINKTAMLRRLSRGWNVERAVEKPMRKRQTSKAK